MRAREQDKKWFPKWLKGYVRFHGWAADLDKNLDMDPGRVIGYLRS
jgi:hypothetical protein